MKNRLCRLLAFLLIALLLTAAGCSANTEQISSTAAKAQTNDYSRGSAEKAAPQAPEYLDSSSPQQDVAAGRKLIKNVSLTVESLEYDKSLAAIKTRCDTFGGYIQSENSRGVSLNSSGTRSTTIVLRIPADKLDEFLTAADSFGNVTSNVSDTQDVTDSYYDNEAHLATLQIQQERYLELLKKADSMEDILIIEKELTQVRYEIESLTGTLRKYDSLIAYCTVTVSLYEVYDLSSQITPSATLWEKIGDRFTSSVKAFGDFCEFVLLTLVTVLPFVLAIAIIVIIVIVIVRVGKRKKGTKKTENTQQK